MLVVSANVNIDVGTEFGPVTLEASVGLQPLSA